MNPKPYICGDHILSTENVNTLTKYFGYRGVLEYEVCTLLSIGVADFKVGL